MLQIKALVRLGRPWFLVPGFILYVLGYRLALRYGAELDMGRFTWGCAIMFFAHSAVPFSNDFFDQKADSYNSPTRISGGSGALRENPELARWALRASFLLISLSMINALIFQLYYRPSWVFLPMVLFGGLMGLFYSAPPFRLSYRGLGEITTMIAAGVMMPGMGYICAADHIGTGLLMLIPAFLAYGALFILSVEMPDMDADRQGGKRNLLVRYGLRKSLAVIFVSVLFGTLYLGLLAWLQTNESIEYGLLALFSLIPLSAGVSGYLNKNYDRTNIIRRSMLNISSLMLLLLLIDGYLIMVHGW